MRTYFKSDRSENLGINWFIASFGMEPTGGSDHILTTDDVHASEVGRFSGGAKADCELVARLLNAYYNEQIKLPDTDYKGKK